MASDDDSLIAEARALTDYNSEIFTDSEVQEILDIAKDEIRADLGAPELTFYTQETFQATRALFWFTCIGLKVRAGEIAGVDLTVESIEAAQGDVENYNLWFSNFSKRIRAASTSPGPAVASVARDNRTYGDN